MSEEKTIRVIISGGGTGGHIYPALAIANELKRRVKKAEILFVGARGRMEMQKVPEAGYAIEGLWISGIQRKLTLDNLSFPLKLASSLWKAGKILKRFKPDVAIGVGGFASGPLLYQAARRGVPCLIQEQNSFAGLTNKLLANKVERVCVASLGMERFFPEEKIVFTGNPVRSDILECKSSREEALTHFGLSSERPVLLVLGGSLGARTINNAMMKHLKKLDESGIQVLWQVGKFYFEEVQKVVNENRVKNIRIREFIREMDLAYLAADAALSRAGALSVSELCIVRKPTIFVPSPNVAEDHQTKNAEALVNRGAALMIRDSELETLLADRVLELLADKPKQEQMAANMEAFAKPSAAKDIVEEILKLAK
ncbi:MAG: undecaprenyldiphospho-muramoylpentapeptide beta-N-acetylglucosaminyltransferase [Cytophagales bacterium]|nr:undecaprenyldiphospho-muramoylpentapeptide beta-N-acetylglucosaminyltransferase [Cytophagales bacterium]